MRALSVRDVTFSFNNIHVILATRFVLSLSLSLSLVRDLVQIITGGLVRILETKSDILVDFLYCRNAFSRPIVANHKIQ